MALINNKKEYESKNVTGKGKNTVKIVYQPLIRQVWKSKYKNSKIKTTVIS